ncbi:phage head closure protein [Pseudomonas sp. G.S.17]|uniref:phage head closure protein n=1 Tax=Pseudomonas sp. G.S.17 TaxID=3137451 RepID=UPI00311C9B8B
MSLRAGRLRHRINIQKSEPVQDQQTGEMIDVWVSLVEVWASVEPLSSRDLIAAQAVQSEIVARVLIRARPGINSAMRVIHRGVVYVIKGDPLPDRESGLEYLTLMVAAGVLDE